jgi:transposase-like protein
MVKAAHTVMSCCSMTFGQHQIVSVAQNNLNNINGLSFFPLNPVESENSHRPTRQRERRMQRFKSLGHAQRFLSAYGPIAQHFRPRRHLLSASKYREEMRSRFESWAEMTGTKRAT